MRPEEFYINLQSSDKTLDMLEEWGLLPDLDQQKRQNCNGDLKIRVKIRKGNFKYFARCKNVI